MAEVSYKKLSQRLQRDLDLKADQINRLRGTLKLPPSASTSARSEQNSSLVKTLQEEVEAGKRKLALANQKLLEVELHGVRDASEIGAPVIELLMKEVQELRVRCVSYELERDLELKTRKQIEASLDEKEELLITTVRDMEQVEIELRAVREREKVEMDRLTVDADQHSAKLESMAAHINGLEDRVVADGVLIEKLRSQMRLLTVQEEQAEDEVDRLTKIVKRESETQEIFFAQKKEIETLRNTVADNDKTVLELERAVDEIQSLFETTRRKDIEEIDRLIRERMDKPHAVEAYSQTAKCDLKHAFTQMDKRNISVAVQNDVSWNAVSQSSQIGGTSQICVGVQKDVVWDAVSQSTQIGGASQVCVAVQNDAFWNVECQSTQIGGPPQVCVDKDCQIGGEALVEQSCQIGGEARFEQSCQIGGEALVEQSCQIGGEALVEQSCQIGGEALVEQSCQIGGEALVEQSCQMGGEALVEQSCQIGGEALVEQSCQIGGEALVEQSCQIGGEALVEQSCQIGGEALVEQSCQIGGEALVEQSCQVMIGMTDTASSILHNECADSVDSQLIITGLEDDLAISEFARRSIEEELRSLQDQFESNMATANTKSLECSNLATECTKLKKQIDMQTEACADLNTQLDRKAIQITELEAALTNKTIERTENPLDKRKDTELASERLNTLCVYSCYENHCLKLEIEIEQLRAALMAVESLESKCAILQSDNDRLTRDRDQVQAGRGELRCNNDEWSSKYAALKAERDGLSSDLTELQHQTVISQFVHEPAASDNEWLKSRIEQLEGQIDQLSSLEAQSDLLEVIADTTPIDPFFGALVLEPVPESFAARARLVKDNVRAMMDNFSNQIASMEADVDWVRSHLEVERMTNEDQRVRVVAEFAFEQRKRHKLELIQIDARHICQQTEVLWKRFNLMNKKY